MKNPLDTSPVHQAKFAVLVLMACVGGLYGQFLDNAIIFDDLYFFMVDTSGAQPVDSYVFSLFGLRSLPYATLTWTKELFGLGLVNFRLGNLFLHMATVLALYGFVKYILVVAYTGKSSEAMTASQGAFLAAFLFALHPLATYAVGYLVQRTIIMASLFSLLAMLAYAKGSLENKPAWLWLSVPLYYLAVFSKEHAIMLVAVLVVLTVLLHSDWRDKLRSHLAVFAALACIALVVVWLRKELAGYAYEPDAKGMLGKELGALAYPLSVVTQCGLFFKYVALWLVPNTAWTSIDMRETFVRSLVSPHALAVPAYIAWGAAAVWLLFKRGNKGLLGFAMLCPWLMFFTELYSVRIQEPFVIYRSYLWASAGFMAVPVLLAGVNRKMVTLVFAAVGVTLLMLSMERMMTFSNPILVWDDARKLVEKNPQALGAERIYYNLGRHQLLNDMLVPSEQNLSKAIAIDPNFPQAQGALGAVYVKQRLWSKAIAQYTLASAIDKKLGAAPSSVYLVGRARAYESAGQPDKAIVDYLQACQIDQRVCESLRKSANKGQHKGHPP